MSAPPDRCTRCGSDLPARTEGPAVCPRCAFGFAMASEEPDPAAGERLGPYRLGRLLGEGGMGTVWEAFQEEPVRRRVALKRIKPGLDSAQVLARFESERQALALMNHPNIARVFDAGQAQDGRPYFAMEYVDGPWITRYCDAQRLGIRERLDLFMEVCEGIQHAHHKGIIHRDIKPSNVLVQSDGGKPVPKVIDFGIAKATESRLTERTLVTGLGQPLGTPEYMSPEQAGTGGFDVDTRTDVYSLGVLLYSLLTGRLPLEAPKDDPDEVRRQIRETEPPLPSARVAALATGRDAEPIAEARATDGATLSKRLRGDLDWIVMKALAKDRARRYSSPDDLVADIRRHLADEPVLAGPPSRSYRVAKFVRRHTLAVTAGSAIALVLLVTTVGMTVMARRLALARDRATKEATAANAALEFLTRTFEIPDPSEGRGAKVTAGEILDRGAAQVERTLGGAPEVQARLLMTIGRTYMNLGLNDRAEPLLRHAVDLDRRALGAEDPHTCRAMAVLADCLRGRPSYKEAETVAREAVAALARRVGPEVPESAVADASLATVLAEQGRLKDAEPLLRTALATYTRTSGPDDRDTLLTSSLLAQVVARLGRMEEAEALQRQSVDGLRRIDGDGAYILQEPLQALASALRSLGRLPEAEASYREALAILRKTVGDDHPNTCDTLSALGRVLTDMGRPAEGEPLIRAAVDGFRRGGQERTPRALKSLADLAYVLMAQRRLAEAEPVYREALQGFRETLGDDHPNTLRLDSSLGHMLVVAGRPRDAEPFLRMPVERLPKTLGPDHPDVAKAQSNLAESLVLQEKYADALPVLTDALQVERKKLPLKHMDTGTTLERYGQCLIGLRRFDEAEAALREADDIMQSVEGDRKPHRGPIIRDFIRLYKAWGRPDQVARWQAEEQRFNQAPAPAPESPRPAKKPAGPGSAN